MPMFRVTHRQGDVETVFVVDAADRVEAREKVADDFCLSRIAGTFAVVPAETPVRLYAINTKTGEMT